jgi:hypothetical protein
MGDGEVRRENRHGIAEDQVFASVEDPFLVFRKMIQAEETWPLVYPGGRRPPSLSWESECASV